MTQPNPKAVSVVQFLAEVDVHPFLSGTLLTDAAADTGWPIPGVTQDMEHGEYRVAALAAVECITGIQAERFARPTYRLTFTDGQYAKCRIVRAPWIATRLCWMSRNMPTRRIARMYACHETVLFEEWVDGAQVHLLPLTPELARQAGLTLAKIHRIAFRQPYANPEVEPAFWQQRAEDEVAKSVALGLLTGDAARSFGTYFKGLFPQQLEGGIVHQDYCAENLVQLPNGPLTAIDNETVNFGAFDYDLARTKRRWPMGSGMWQRFLAGYAELRSVDSFLHNSGFWDTFVALESARFHSDHQTEQAAADRASLAVIAAKLASL